MQAVLEAALERRRPTLLRAKVGHHLVLHVEDVHVPLTCQPTLHTTSALEFLRQLLDTGGCTDVQRADCCVVPDACVVASGLANHMPHSPAWLRFQRHFMPIHLIEADRGHTALFSNSDMPLVRNMCQSLLTSLSNVLDNLDHAVTAVKLASFLGAVAKCALDGGGQGGVMRGFGVLAVRKVLLKVHADLAQVPVKFTVYENKLDLITATVSGKQMLSIFGDMLEQEAGPTGSVLKSVGVCPPLLAIVCNWRCMH